MDVYLGMKGGEKEFVCVYGCACTRVWVCVGVCKCEHVDDDRSLVK